jgi:N-acetylmuramoyl-L-alanine amidase
MVKRILSIGILTLFLVTSLVAAYQHHQLNAETSSVTMSDSRRQYKYEKYYNNYNEEQYEQKTSQCKSNKIVVTPSPIPVIEEDYNAVKIDVSNDRVKQNKTDNKINITSTERKILERIVEAEATDQSIEARENVASVILNRVSSDSFPDNIKAVVFQKNQFSPIQDGRYDKVKITEETVEAVNNIVKDGVTNNALYFCNSNDVKSAKNKKWFKQLKFLFKDDSGHSFYTE